MFRFIAAGINFYFSTRKSGRPLHETKATLKKTHSEFGWFRRMESWRDFSGRRTENIEKGMLTRELTCTVSGVEATRDASTETHAAETCTRPETLRRRAVDEARLNEARRHRVLWTTEASVLTSVSVECRTSEWLTTAKVTLTIRTETNC